MGDHLMKSGQKTQSSSVVEGTRQGESNKPDGVVSGDFGGI